MKKLAFVVIGVFAVGTVLAVEVSSGPVRPGEWNSNLDAVLDLAVKEHRPMLLVHASTGCSICSRLNAAMEGVAFRRWQKDRGLLMAYVRTGSDADDAYKRARRFVKSVDPELSGFPYVCVWWPKPDGTTNSVAFSGRRGQMGEVKSKVLSIALMGMLDKSLAEYLATRLDIEPLPQIISNSTRVVSCKAAGSAGTVEMMPGSGILPEGGTVTLVAVPEPGSLFVCWEDEKGRKAGWKPELKVLGAMSAGPYTATFRTKADCPPPELPSATTTLVSRVGVPVKYSIPVSEKSRPVKFKMKNRMMAGVKFNDEWGDIYCTPKKPGVYTAVVLVIGSDPARTVKKYTIEIDVAPRKNEN